VKKLVKDERFGKFENEKTGAVTEREENSEAETQEGMRQGDVKDDDKETDNKTKIFFYVTCTRDGCERVTVDVRLVEPVQDHVQ
jgi:hypothetical protein